LYLLAIVGGALLVTLPILIYGIPKGNDLPQHYQFASAFRESIRNGVFYPGWSPAVNSGYGDVSLRFYPPLAYYVLTFFDWVAGSWFGGSVLTFWFWFALGGIGIYFWSREWFDEQSSIFAALIYLVMPYHANQIYNAFLYAEFAACAILPFCFLFVTRVCRRGNLADVVGLAASYSLLILTHLPLTVIGSICLGVYSVVLLRRSIVSLTTVKLAAAVLVSLAATAVFWVRMLSELDLVKVTTPEFQSGSFDFHSNFLLSYFSTTAGEYSDRSLVFADLMLIATLAIVIPAAAVFLFKAERSRRFILIPVASLLICALFFATPASSLLWEKINALAKTQFPWRWLSIISMSGAVLAAASVRPTLDLFRTSARPVALLAAGLVTIGIAFTFAQVIRPAIYLPRAEFENYVADISHAESCECLWPVWARKDALKNTKQVAAVERSVDVSRWDPLDREFTIKGGSAAEARIATFYYPNWKASVNGNPIEVHAADDGSLALSIPQGPGDIKVWFEESKRFFISAAISGAAWLSILIAIFTAFRRRGDPSN
jgi:hypothetical protein